MKRLAQGDWRVERDRSCTGHGKAQIRGSRASGPPRLSKPPRKTSQKRWKVTPSHSSPSPASSSSSLKNQRLKTDRRASAPLLPAPRRDNQARKNKLKSPRTWQGLGKFGLTGQEHLTKLTSSITGVQSFRYWAFD